MVTVYSQPACVQCTATYRKLDALAVKYRVVDVSRDPEALDKIKGLGYLQAPVVITEDGTHWSGFDPSRLEALV